MKEYFTVHQLIPVLAKTVNVTQPRWRRRSDTEKYSNRLIVLVMSESCPVISWVSVGGRDDKFRLGLVVIPSSRRICIFLFWSNIRSSAWFLDGGLFPPLASSARLSETDQTPTSSKKIRSHITLVAELMIVFFCCFIFFFSQLQMKCGKSGGSF